MAKEYVKLWLSYDAYFEPLSTDEVGRLALAMLAYKARGTQPSFSGNERFIWPAIQRDIDLQTEAQEHTGSGKTGLTPPTLWTTIRPTAGPRARAGRLRTGKRRCGPGSETEFGGRLSGRRR